MIQYLYGDLLLDSAEAFVNPVNTIGVSGKGLAKRFKERSGSGTYSESGTQPMNGECINCGESGNWCRCDEPHCDHSQFQNAWGVDKLGRHINGKCLLCEQYLMVTFFGGEFNVTVIEPENLPDTLRQSLR